MVEGKLGGKGDSWEYPRLRGVVGTLGLPFRTANENDRNRMPSRIPARIRVNVELANELHREASLLKYLSNRSLLHRFPGIDESSRQGPAGRRTFSTNQDEVFATQFDDHVDCKARLAIGHPWSPKAVILYLLQQCTKK